MKKFQYSLWIGVGLLVCAIRSFAVTADLVTAYQDGLKNDPTYAEAKATFLANKEAVAEARSALLPQLSVSGTIFQQGVTSTTANNIAITVNQVIFGMSTFAQIAQARAAVREAAATLAAAQQDLMFRVTQAYLAIVQAQDLMDYTKEQMLAHLRQLQALQERYKYGHTTITDIDQARGAYDTIRSQYITAEITLYDTYEALSQVTGVHYDSVSMLKKDFPLISPQPESAEAWLKKAQVDNLAFKASNLGVIAAERNIGVQVGNLFPTLNGTATWNSKQTTTSTQPFTYGISLSYSAYQGGLTDSQIRRAEAQYQGALAKRKAAYLKAVADSQRAYVGVVSGVRRVKASRQAIKSNEDALKHTEEGFIAGTQTVLDILQTQNRLFESQKLFVEDRVRYMNSLVQLELAVGTLSPQTLVALNHWFTHPKKPKQAMRGGEKKKGALVSKPIPEHKSPTLRNRKTRRHPDKPISELRKQRKAYLAYQRSLLPTPHKTKAGKKTKRAYLPAPVAMASKTKSATVKAAKPQKTTRVAKATKTVRKAKLAKSKKMAQAAKPVRKATLRKPKKTAKAAKSVRKTTLPKPKKTAKAAKPVRKTTLRKPKKTAKAAKPVRKATLPKPKKTAKAAKPVRKATLPKPKKVANVPKRVRKATLPRPQKTVAATKRSTKATLPKPQTAKKPPKAHTTTRRRTLPVPKNTLQSWLPQPRKTSRFS